MHDSKQEGEMAARGASMGRKAPRTPQGFAEAAQTRLTGSPPRAAWADTLLRTCDREGLLAGDKSQHVTFRAPPALIEAAKLNLGIESTSELGILALLLLAQADPAVDFMKRSRGVLGADHSLEG